MASPGLAIRPDGQTSFNGQWTAGGLGRGLLMSDNNNFALRAGFAYLVDKSTVVRGAYIGFVVIHSDPGYRRLAAGCDEIHDRSQVVQGEVLEGPGQPHGA
jgi:hypothetical protein